MRSEQSHLRVGFIAVVPPPLTGMTVVTESMRNVVSSVEGFTVHLRTVQRRTSQGEFAWRVSKYWNAIVSSFQSGRDSDVGYVVSESGFGLLITTLQVLILRLMGRGVVLHHHTRNYLDSTSALFRLVALASPDTTRHIVLAEKFGKQLASRYGRVSESHVTVVPNYFAIGRMDVPVGREDRDFARLVVGFAGNRPADKGLEVVVKAAERLSQQGRDIEVWFAGQPSTRDDIELLTRLKRHGCLVELGLLDRAGMRDFYERIDVLAFPSAYQKEAQPMVVLEALMSGVPVFASPVGDLPRLLSGSDFLFDSAEELHDLLERCTSPDSYRTLCTAATVIGGRIRAEASRVLPLIEVVFREAASRNSGARFGANQ